jgi:formate hydrogenlyase transcriptional activator
MMNMKLTQPFFANEEKEYGKEFLLSVSNELGGLREFDELIPIINNNLRTFFGFDHSHICTIADDEASFDVFIFDQNTQFSSGISQEQLTKLPVDERFLRIVTKTNVPLTMVLNKYDQHYFQEFYDQMEVDQDALLTRLVKGGRVIGWWTTFFYDEQSLINCQSRLLEAVADQLSISVANIVANRAMIRKEKEKELLLGLSSQMAGVRSRKELMPLFNEFVKPLLNFNHIALAEVNIENGDVMSLVHDPASVCINDARYEKLRTEMFFLNDGYLNRVTEGTVPVIFNCKDYFDNADLPLYFRLNFENGIQQVITAKLKRFNKLVGLWGLFFKTEKKWDVETLRLIQGIADQVSIAISNIDAIELIEQREEQTSRLLAFSNAVASVKDRSSLGKIFSCYVKDLCTMVDYCLHWVSEDKKEHYPYLWDTLLIQGASGTDEDYMLNKASVNDGIFNVVRDTGKMMVFDISVENQRPDCPEYIRILKSKNVERLLAYPLYVGEELAGMFLARYNAILAAKQDMVTGLCSQLAVAVSNLIAKEKVNRQLEEISRYKEQLEEERIYLKEELDFTHNSTQIIGESDAIKNVFKSVSQVAASDSAVLILGETGTGKELVGRAIHENSQRKDKLMVKLNCAALPPNLIESELFGHEKGSFTGALDRRIGKFELANGGTLFLDEIGEMPLELQSRLLRVLQEKEIERIGGKTTIAVDVRIIAATNRDLQVEVSKGRFRSDLYYRLNVFPISLPPLRERVDDISLLASHFIGRFAKKYGKNILNFSAKALKELQSYSWPGNIRELEHLIERIVLLTVGCNITSFKLPSNGNSLRLKGIEDQRFKTIDENERDHIMKVLKSCGGRIGGDRGAANILGVPASTLSSKMRRLGIKRRFNI